MAQYLPSKPAAIPLIAALAANSFHLYGNLGALQTGCIPYTQQTSSSPYERVRGTNFFIKNGIVLAASAFVSGFLYSGTAFSTSDSHVQRLTTVAAVSALTMLPYTILVMLPTNKALAQTEKSGVKGESQETEAMEMVARWKWQHNVRIGLGLVAWIAGIIALEKS